MSDFDWKKAVATIAPSLAAALVPELGLAGVAIRAIGEAVGIPNATEQQVSAAIAQATPADLLAIKQADQQFEKDMAAIGVDLAKIAAEDRANAREREIKTGDSWTPRILAAVVVVGYLSVQWYILSHIVPQEMREIVLRSMGTLDMALGLVLGYYFGSSAGSARKDVVIGHLSTEK
ncbi:MAG: hypothetical protein HY016_13060 [Nitrosomonadales bacterium]|nr:hypothetical protein [Nitrosomonadales bacterium]